MTDRKKKTAVIAAVAHYIQTTEAAMAHAAGFSAPEPETKASAAMMPNLWGISGRHQQMQMRSMMQMKAFHGSSRSKF